jgi:nicotinic acetylcholine receptor
MTVNNNEKNISDSELTQSNDERRLVEYLMRNYDNNIRPVKDASTPVIIRLGITLTQIFDLVFNSFSFHF